MSPIPNSAKLGIAVKNKAAPVPRSHFRRLVSWNFILPPVLGRALIIAAKRCLHLCWESDWGAWWFSPHLRAVEQLGESQTPNPDRCVRWLRRAYIASP